MKQKQTKKEIKQIKELQKNDYITIDKDNLHIIDETINEVMENNTINRNVLQTICKFDTTEIDKIISKVCDFEKLRSFQRDGLRIMIKKHQDYLIGSSTEKVTNVSAYPGAGKTFLALLAIKIFILMGWIQKAIIIVPSTNLQNQWKHEASNPKIDLHITNGRADGKLLKLRNRFHARCITYQTLTSENSRQQLIDDCKKYSVFYVCDESHHMAVQNLWGKFAEKCATSAVHILLLSGTPFRTKIDERIPFAIATNKDGLFWEYKFDVSFGYEDGLREKTHCISNFYDPDGIITYTKGDKIYKNNFSDTDISDLLKCARLSAALDFLDNHKNTYLPELLHNANVKLTDIRRRNKIAQGLIVAKNSKHAGKIKEFLESIGETPRIALSIISQSNTTIQDFIKFPERRDHKWLIAVKMVAEGTDIKNLVVGVYATNIVTAGFIIQTINRCTRYLDWKENENGCHWFIPKDDRIIKIAKTFDKITQLFQLEKEQNILQECDLDVIAEAYVDSDAIKESNKPHAISSEMTSTTVFSMPNGKIYDEDVFNLITKMRANQPQYNTIPFDLHYDMIIDAQEKGTSISIPKKTEKFEMPPQNVNSKEDNLKQKRNEINNRIRQKIFVCSTKGVSYDHAKIFTTLYKMMGPQYIGLKIADYDENELELLDNKVTALFANLLHAEKPNNQLFTQQSNLRAKTKNSNTQTKIKQSLLPFKKI